MTHNAHHDTTHHDTPFRTVKFGETHRCPGVCALLEVEAASRESGVPEKIPTDVEDHRCGTMRVAGTLVRAHPALQ